jgi:hypothetical protein
MAKSPLVALALDSRLRNPLIHPFINFVFDPGNLTFAYRDVAWEIPVLHVFINARSGLSRLAHDQMQTNQAA